MQSYGVFSDHANISATFFKKNFEGFVKSFLLSNFEIRINYAYQRDKMKILRVMVAVIASMLATLTAAGRNPETDFIHINAHILGGGSYVSNNYAACFPEVSDLHSSMGLALGVGADVVFNISHHWGVGTGLNILRSSRNLDMAVSTEGAKSISNIFQKNSYYTIEAPVFARWRQNLAQGVTWNIDMGLYMAQGVRGHTDNTIYDAKTNELGQLITLRTKLRTRYYDDGDAFINTFARTDLGMHLATGLTFRQGLTIGVRTHIGLRNLAQSDGLKNPRMRTLDLLAVVGWSF